MTFAMKKIENLRLNYQQPCHDKIKIKSCGAMQDCVVLQEKKCLLSNENLLHTKLFR